MATKQIKVCDNCGRQEDQVSFSKVLELDICPICYDRLYLHPVTITDVCQNKRSWPVHIKLAGYYINPVILNGIQILNITKDPECL